MNFTRKDLFAIFFLTILVLVFFSQLFIPVPKLFITPELGVSDIWQFNYPIKDFLHKSLLRGELPLWSKDMGAGFPVLAEAQIGTFYIINLLLFFVFPTWLGFNLSYITTFLISSISMYLLLKYFKLTILSRTFGAFIFSFSGFFITHISHINMIQTAAFLPLIFLLALLIIGNKQQASKKYSVLLIIVLAQQIFAGFPQMVFLTLYVVFLFYIFTTGKMLLTRKYKDLVIQARRFTLLVTLILITVLLAGIQIIPTYELTKLSLRTKGLGSREVLFYSFKPELFATLVHPFIKGSPKDGTYPDYAKYDGAIFWENIPYIGILPLFLIAYTVIRRKKTQIEIFCTFLAILSALLMLGKHSPLYLVLTFPPVNFFRIHSRFILPFIFALSILASFGLNSLENIVNKSRYKRYTKTIILTILGVSIINLYAVWFNYHPTQTVADWLKEPEIVSILKKQPDLQRIFSLNRYSLWKEYFLKEGWKNKDAYIDARNTLHPNSNLVYDISQFGLYSALYTKRRVLVDELVQSGFKGQAITTEIATTSGRYISAFGISHIVATTNFADSNFTQVYKTKNDVFGFAPLTVLKNNRVLPRARIIDDYKLATTVGEAKEILDSLEFDPQKSVLLESDIQLSPDAKLLETEVLIIEDTNQRLDLKVTSNKNAILLVSDSYYPGWKAYINNTEAEILPANFNSRAVVIPEGSSIVSFVYKPESLTNGLLVSGIGLLLTSFLAVGQISVFLPPESSHKT